MSSLQCGEQWHALVRMRVHLGFTHWQNDALCIVLNTLPDDAQQFDASFGRHCTLS